MTVSYRNRRRLSKLADNVIYYAVLFSMLAFFMFVFLWMVLSSFKTNVQITAYPPLWIFTPTLQNYVDVFTQNRFLSYFLNSTVIALASVSIGLLIGLPAAYAMARHRLTPFAFMMLASRILPAIVFLVPLFIIYRDLRLINTHLGIVITHVIIVLPMIIWIMAGFFQDLPVELEDSAMVDGCSRAGAFVRIILPLSMPGIVAAVILSFIASWNNFIFVLILGGRNTTTLPMAVYSFMSFEDINWGGLCAAATIITLPIIILAFFVQRQLTGGLTMGAVKG
jgi:multiple sugar transport system permease protein